MGDPVQARVMRFMPIMFTVMFLFFPAGLVLYWLVNNLLSLAQQWYIMRQMKEARKHCQVLIATAAASNAIPSRPLQRHRAAVALG